MTATLTTEIHEAIVAGQEIAIPLPADTSEAVTLRNRVRRAAVRSGWDRNYSVSMRGGQLRFRVTDPATRTERPTRKAAATPEVEEIVSDDLTVFDGHPDSLRAVKDAEFGWALKTTDGLFISLHANREEANAELHRVREATRAHRAAQRAAKAAAKAAAGE